MFYLRTIHPTFTENTYLGVHYSVVCKKNNSAAFKHIVKENGINDTNAVKIINGTERENCVILSEYPSYIVTENGNTYERL